MLNLTLRTKWCHPPGNIVLRSIILGACILGFCAFNGKTKYARCETDQARAGIQFSFKQQSFWLPFPMKRERYRYRRNRTGLTNAQLDTLSNWFSLSGNYVEIIRQDDPLDPHFGLALGFTFDPEEVEYPYSPKEATLQFKDFNWGGVEFSLRDSSNYTGISNEVSDDLTVYVDSFQNDTITGRFHGLLICGAGTMAPIDSGYFRAFLYRVE